MILYDNREQLGAILHLKGTVVYKMLPLSLVAAAVSVGVNWWKRWSQESEEGVFWLPLVHHPFAAMTLSGAVTFALVFRTSLAWNRYWDACVQAAFMYSKWSDSFTTLISFINHAESDLLEKDSSDAREKLEELAEIRASLVHNFSLLSALAVHRLIHGDLARMRRRSDMLGMRSRLCCPCGFYRMLRNWNMLFSSRRDLRFQDISGAYELPDFSVLSVDGAEEVKSKAKAKLNNAFSKLAPALKLRAGRVEHSENRAAAEQEGDEGDSSSDMRSDKSVARRFSNVTWSSDLVIVGALTYEEKQDLSTMEGSQPDRPNILFEWISEDINFLIKVCGIPPPIMSRCYQELSNGMLGFSQSIKVADIPFPFPFSQLLEVLLVAFTLVLPFYTAYFTQGMVITPLLTFGITIAIWSLSEISRELENPYADGPNQLPVIDTHERFVENLRGIYRLVPNRRRQRQEAAAAAAAAAADAAAYVAEY